MKHVHLWCLSALIIAQGAAALPENHGQRNALEQQNYLWQQCVEHPWKTLPPWSGAGWSSIWSKLSSVMSLASTFDHQSDELPVGRSKLLHPFGSVAKVRWTPAPHHPFTGLFHSGARGIARFSLAGDPAIIGFTPGLAIKLFINGNPSRNIFAMNSLEGQGSDYNFFARDFSNEIPPASGWALRIGEFIFNRIKSPANKLTVDHLATINSDGSAVLEPIAPERLVFKPHPTVTSNYGENLEADMRERFSEFAAGTVLYSIVGYYQGQEHDVGELELASVPLASQYGDKQLFFQHPR